MKKNIWIAGLFLIMCLPTRSIYSIKVKPVEGGANISMSAYANKKILITAINAARPDIKMLQLLDSLQRADTSLRVVAVPAIDFGGEGNDAAIAALKDSLALGFIITRPGNVKKNAGGSQHPLFKWLTDFGENDHFDRDAEATGQYFIINRNGMLYSVLVKDTPTNILRQVISQEF